MYNSAKIKRINVGDLKERVIIQTASAENESGTNEVIYTWLDSYEVWAIVSDIRGDEKTIANKKTAVSKINVIIKAQDNYNNVRNRLKYNGLIYDIESAIFIEQKNYIEINAINLK